MTPLSEDPRRPAVSGTTICLSETQGYVLWRMAQHKYGWGYVNSLGHRSAARALERRGLVTVRGDHAGWTAEVTDEGRDFIATRWPVSPLTLNTYTRPETGWDGP